MSNATLTISLNDYNALLASRAAIEADLIIVSKELEAAKLVDPSGRLPALVAFSRDCLTLARFAVANLPPEMIRGWPYEALRRIAAELPTLPDATADDRDMALDLINFAKDCEDHEIRRRAEPRATKMTPADVEEHRKRLEGDPIAQALMARMQETKTP
jgi:hypothetical protein